MLDLTLLSAVPLSLAALSRHRKITSATLALEARGIRNTERKRKVAINYGLSIDK
jgi:hypothetical protein